MSGPGERGAPRTEMLSRLTRWTTAVSLAASSLPAAIAGLPAGTAADLVAAAAAAAVVTLLQIAAVRLASRRALGRHDGGDRQEGSARRFVIAVVLSWSGVGLLLGPPLLAAAFSAMGAGLGGTCCRHIAVHLAGQAVFALAMHRVARGLALALPAPTGRDSMPRSPGRGLDLRLAGPFQPHGLLLAMLLPAAGLAASLGWAGVEATRLMNLGSAAAGYARIAEGALGTPPLPDAGGIRGLVEALTPFDEAAPFTVAKNGAIAGSLDRERRARVAEATTGRPAGVSIDAVSGQVVVWNAPGPAGVVAGIHLALPADSGLPGIIAALIFAAALLGALAAAGLRSWLWTRLSARVAAIEALPDRAVPPLPPGPIRELTDLDRTISALAARFSKPAAADGDAATDTRSSRERKAQVFAGMSHDLRSPLNSVVGFTDLLLKGMDGELRPAQRAKVAIIAEAAERLLVQIGDILDTARLDAGRFEIERAWVPSVEILTECAAGAERLVASKNVIFRSRLQPGLPPVRVDKSRIVQALLSLVARAVEATERGVILLEAKRLPGGGGLRVEIGDPEGAVGADRRARIARAWRIAQDSWDGLGASGAISAELGPAALGLSLARRMVALHGGTVAAGTDPGDRVLFALTLPLDSDPDEG